MAEPWGIPAETIADAAAPIDGSLAHAYGRSTGGREVMGGVAARLTSEWRAPVAACASSVVVGAVLGSWCQHEGYVEPSYWTPLTDAGLPWMWSAFVAATVFRSAGWVSGRLGAIATAVSAGVAGVLAYYANTSDVFPPRTRGWLYLAVITGVVTGLMADAIVARNRLWKASAAVGFPAVAPFDALRMVRVVDGEVSAGVWLPMGALALTPAALAIFSGLTARRRRG